MTEDICVEESCDRGACVRGLCRLHYRRRKQAGTLPPATPRHTLIDVDVESRTATCVLCGPTRIRVRGGRRGNQCYTLRTAERSRERGAPGYKRSRNAWVLAERYGITRAEWDEMLTNQSGLCAICEAPLRAPRTDHCHKTGQVRGLLCNSCNIGIGWFRDDAKRLRAAAVYLAA